jgi:hypothetical protein
MATNTRGPIGPRSNSSNPRDTTKKGFVWKSPPSDWPADIKGLYNSLRKSSNFKDFEESDMWMLRVVCGQLAEFYFDPEKNASHFKNLMALMLEFAPTIASRRRLSLEVEKVVETAKQGQLMEAMVASVLSGNKVVDNND